MAFNQAAMAAFADYTVANCNGRTRDLAGNDLNVDGRYGYQCMDLWIWARYRLGFTDNIPTPDAAAVWEMNWTAPTNRMWDYFDAITPDQPAMPGDFGIMNRSFFGNGIGHIFMILADLGNSIRVLELNGLGDGFEDSAGGQHGSPARIHDWPKTYLYGYLRWIGTPPAVSGQANTITPITEEGFLMALPETRQAQVADAADRTIGTIPDRRTPSGTVVKVAMEDTTFSKADGAYQNRIQTDVVKALGRIENALGTKPDKTDLAAAILAGGSGDPSIIAKAVIDAVGDGLAKEVVDAIGAALSGGGK